MSLVDLSKVPFGTVSGIVNDPHLNISFAQEGEDILLARILENQIHTPGFYVDVGAHHPRRFSNTWLLHAVGWRGLNIDARPGMKAEFDRERPEDINLEMAVGEEETELPYYCFNEPALNTFDPDRVKHYQGHPVFRLEKTVSIEAAPLHVIMKRHDAWKFARQLGGQIGLLSIDVEGFDLLALKGLDWDLWRPRFILIEDSLDFENLGQSEIYVFLKEKKYKLLSRLLHSCLYVPCEAA